jgi:hypothetical protein
MMRDLFDAVGRDAPAAEHVCEKWPDVVAPFGAAERNDEDRIEHSGPFLAQDINAVYFFFASAFFRLSATAFAAFWSASPSAASNDEPP